MKSLEIIDKYIGTVYALSDDELKQIKQDLEVLEIIKNKQVYVTYLLYAIKQSNTDNEILNLYNSILGKKHELTMEELFKVKQWLEEYK